MTHPTDPVAAMREACAKACVIAARECPGSSDEETTWREAAMWCLNRIRALPLPAAPADDAVCPSCGMPPNAGRHANYAVCYDPCHAAPAHDAVPCPECAARKPDDGDWWARQVEKATSLAALKSIAAGWPMTRPAPDAVREAAKRVADCEPVDWDCSRAPGHPGLDAMIAAVANLRRALAAERAASDAKGGDRG